MSENSLFMQVSVIFMGATTFVLRSNDNLRSLSFREPVSIHYMVTKVVTLTLYLPGNTYSNALRNLFDELPVKERT